jgi:TRAP-type C4-dicarboxylate transport system substrate-binding protein
VTHFTTAGVLRRATLTLVSGLALAAVAATTTVVHADTLTMKIGTATINDTQHEWMKRFKARVEKRTGGAIKIKLFPASQLGKIPRMIEGLQLGTIESLVTPSAFLIGVDRRNSVLSVPGLFKDVNHCWRVFGDKEFRALMFPLMEKKGITAIGILCTAPQAFLTKKKINRLADLKGLRIRVLASPLEIGPMKAVGIKPVPMPLGEVVPGLKQNLIDGVSSIPVLFGKLKMDTVAKHITTSSLIYFGVPIYVSMKFWNKTTPAQKKIMLEEARAIELNLIEWNTNANNGVLAGWKKRGGTVTALPAADQAKLASTVNAAAAKFIASKPALNAFFQKVNAIVQRHK